MSEPDSACPCRRDLLPSADAPLGCTAERPLPAIHVRDRSMYTTPVSLLERLHQPAADEAWQRFVKLYTPLLYHWACRVGLQGADAADLVQDVLTLLVQKLPEFKYDSQKSFRAWLRTVML